MPDASCAARSGSRGKTSRPRCGLCKSALRWAQDPMPALPTHRDLARTPDRTEVRLHGPCCAKGYTFRCILARRTEVRVDASAICRHYRGITRCPHSSFPFPHLSPRRRAPRFCCEPYHPEPVLGNLFMATLTTLNAKSRRHIVHPRRPCPKTPTSTLSEA